MASLDVMPVSSPPRQFLTYNLSSSPSLPSPRDICRMTLQDSKGGAPLAPTSQISRATFTTAASLLKSPYLADETITRGQQAARGTEDPLRGKPITKSTLEKIKISTGGSKDVKLRKTLANQNAEGSGDPTIEKVKVVRKPRAKKSDAVDIAQLGKAPPKPRGKKVDTKCAENVAAKEKPVRKSRARKSVEGLQPKIPKGKVKKPSMKGDLDKSAGSSRVADTVSKHFSAATVKDSPGSIGHGLSEAVRRRTEWTPPAITASNTSTVTPIAINFTSHSELSGLQTSDDEGKGFSDLIESFGYQSSKKDGPGKKLPTKSATRKRKLIEMVSTKFSTTAAASILKRKSPAKKARTITELATSAFAEPEPLDAPDLVAPILQYLTHEGSAITNGQTALGKSRSRSPVKATSKTKRGTAKAPILLSPDSALKQMVRQDFVFGTSSQLAREDSPSLLRALHEAMQASNEPDLHSLSACSSEETTGDSQSTIRSDATRSSSRNLWSAAFRNPEGKLLDAEVVDLVDSPPISKEKGKEVTQDIDPFATEQPLDDVWQDIDNLESKVSPREKIEPKAMFKGVFNAENDPVPQTSSSRGRDADSICTDQKDKDVATNGKALTKTSRGVKKPYPSEEPAMPDYTSYTNAELTKLLASYHFKPIKSRNQMITLLEKCWEGKQRTALAALGTNKALAISAVPSLGDLDKPKSLSHVETVLHKRPRGRPRKDGSMPGSPRKVADPVTAGNTDNMHDTPISPKKRMPKKARSKTRQAVDEISDSDTPTIPSPPRLKTRVGTIPLPLISNNEEATTKPSPKSAQAELFKHITQAVLAEPPTKDISKPSWYEKILLYDPIVLEDLTAWLNTGALEKAGWDGEVDPKQVKNWCLSKSICCLWRENLRGGTRSRY